MNSNAMERTISQFLMNQYLDLFKKNPNHWLDYFKNSSVNKFNSLRIVINMIASDSEICNLFELSKIEQIRQGMFQKWENKLKSFSPNLGTNKSTYKKKNYFYRDYIITHFMDASNLEKNLLIGFTGSASLLMSPLPCLIDTLKKLNYDLIIVYRKNRISYFNEDQFLYKKIEKDINKIICTPNYTKNLKKIFSIGTSSGALASLIFAIRNSLQMGIYLGGSISDFNILRSELFKVKSTSSNLLPNTIEQNKLKLLLLGAEDHIDDKKKIFHVRKYLLDLYETLDSEIKFFKDCKKHNFINELIENKNTTLLDIYKDLL